jgi:hypothetical protein
MQRVPKADRPVPPLPPPTQEVGRRSLLGSGALRGRGTKLVVLLVLVVLVLYLVPSLVIESLIAGTMKSKFDTQATPDVKVTSIFPPMMLLGRIDRVVVTNLDQANWKGYVLYDVTADVRGVSVHVPSLINGNLVDAIETESCKVNGVGPNGEPATYDCRLP